MKDRDFQEEIRHLLIDEMQGRCFLRFHQEEKFLFITDFPARCPEKKDPALKKLGEMGFFASEDGRNRDLWALDLKKENWLFYLNHLENQEAEEEKNLRLDFLISLFEKNPGENVDIARFLYRAVHQKKWTGQQKETFYRELSGRYAVILRKKQADRPGKGCAVLLKQLKRSFS